MNTTKQRTLFKFMAVIMVLSLMLVPTGGIRAQSMQPPQPPALLTPFDGVTPAGKGSTGGITGSMMSTLSIGDTFQNGANRLTALQRFDGGWGWPLEDLSSAGSPTNTVGPIAQGLAQAFFHTIDPAHLVALKNAGTFLLTEGGVPGKFSPSAGYLAVTLDSIFGGSTYTNYVKTNYYDKLAAGTYYRYDPSTPDSTAYTTASYVQRIRDSRASQGLATMATWDLGMGLVGAASVGADTGPWVTGVEAEVNELDGKYYDVSGLGAALFGLSMVGATFDPTAGFYASASSLQDLGDILAADQIPSTGGFTWYPGYLDPNSMEGVQYTAYAMLGLNQLNRSRYLSVIQKATDYLAGVQLGTGGWEAYPPIHDGENNEITGEALWALSGSGGSGYPLSEIYVCPSGNCGHPGASSNSIQAAIDAVGHSTIYLDAGTYNQTATILVNKAVTIIGPAGGGAIVQGTNPAAVSVFEISASNVTIQNLTITHSALPAYVSAGWLELPNSLIRIPVSLGLSGIAITDNTIYVPAQTGGMGNWNGVGITVGTGTTTGAGVSITGNTIYNVRDGVVVQYGNTATVSNNVIYYTKGGVMNYTNTQADADNRTMSGNSWGTTHNEWDIVWNTASYVPVYANMLVLSAANNGAYVLDRRALVADQATLTHNRSHVFVNTVTGTLVTGPANGNMNLPYKTVALGNEAVVAGGTVYVSSQMPPLPSNFYGYIHISDGAPLPGDHVNAYVPGVTPSVATAAIITDPGTGFLAYQIDVPGDLDGTPDKEGGVENDLITFMIGTRVVATGTWHGGTNVHLDFHPPEALPGGPYTGTEGSAINFSGSANDWGTDVSTYQWDWNNDGTYDATGQNPSHTWTDQATPTVGLKVTDAQGGVGTTSFGVTVNNVAPTATFNHPNVNEGSDILLSLTAPYDPGTEDTTAGFTYSFACDGISYSTFSSTSTASCPTTDKGTRNVGAKIQDKDSGVTTFTAIVTINDVLPSAVNAGGPYTGTAGQAITTIAGSATCVSVDACTYAWDLDGDSVYDDASGPAVASYTWNTLGDYVIGLKVTDNDGNAVTATANVHIAGALHSIALVPGWNLVSFNLIPANTATATVLSSIAGNYDLIYGWDASGGHSSSGNWLKFAPGGPGYANSLNNLDQTMGFWIHMNIADTLEMVGSVPTTTHITLSNAAGGWNLVGDPTLANRNLPAALTEHFSMVYAYHADEADVWKLYDNTPGIPGFANDLKFLSPGWGYWVKVTATDDWAVGY